MEKEKNINIIELMNIKINYLKIYKNAGKYQITIFY